MLRCCSNGGGLRYSPAMCSLKSCLNALIAELQPATPLEIEAILQDRLPGKVAWKDDLSEMRQRRLIRVLVPNNRTFFFYDGLQPRGLAYEFMTEFVDKLNAGKSTNARLYLMFLPSARDRFIPDIVNGYGDVAIAGLTATASREKAVDFISYDLTMNVMTGANAPALGSVGDAKFDELNRHVFAFAAYSAGPARIQDLRTIAAKEGLDPNEWFNNVEIVAGRKIGRETVDYVRNILKYWVAYHLALDPDEDVQRPAA